MKRTADASTCPDFSGMSRSRRARPGFSLLEILVGTAIFLLIFLSLIKIMTESNLPMQGMIRDSAMAMNLCQRFLNSLTADILAGEPPPAAPNGAEQDVTEAIMEKGGAEAFTKAFSGVGKETTELTVNFKALLSIEDVGGSLAADFGTSAERYYRLKIRCSWGRERQHAYALQTLVYRR